MTTTFQHLGPGDIPAFRHMLSVFSEGFDDPQSYAATPPSDGYIQDRLNDDGFIALLAYANDKPVGALAAYELKKFEQERREFYIYDLAVLEQHRRQGVASGLIARLQDIAKTRGAYVIFVQADHGDDPAIALYTKLGEREDVLHFDIPPG